MWRSVQVGCLSMALVSASWPVLAQDFKDTGPLGLDEVRLGIHSHAAYHTFLPLTPWNFRFDDVSDISGDLIFETPDWDFMTWLGSPRPLIGATLNFSGKESLIYAGLNWHWQVFDTPFYLEGTFGAAAHNGYLDGAPAGMRNLGCRVNFYEVFGIGANLGENVTATLTYEHTSNAGLCERNQGLSNFGVRLGWAF